MKKLRWKKGELNMNTPQISDDLIKEVAFTFFQEMMSDDSWIKQYEKETGKCAYEVPATEERKSK